MAEAIAQLFVNLLRARPGEDTGAVTIVQAAGEGKLDVVRDIVKKSPEKVDEKSRLKKRTNKRNIIVHMCM